MQNSNNIFMEALKSELLKESKLVESSTDKKYTYDDILNLFNKGAIIEVGKEGYTPTKFKVKNGDVLYSNKELTFGSEGDGFDKHPNSVDEIINHILNLQDKDFDIDLVNVVDFTPEGGKDADMQRANDLVKDWYKSEYPSDELGDEINSNITFNDVFEALDNYKDIYKLLGVGDSIVRERVFDELADIMGVDYDYIYGQWLLGEDDSDELDESIKITEASIKGNCISGYDNKKVILICGVIECLRLQGDFDEASDLFDYILHYGWDGEAFNEAVRIVCDSNESQSENVNFLLSYGFSIDEASEILGYDASKFAESKEVEVADKLVEKENIENREVNAMIRNAGKYVDELSNYGLSVAVYYYSDMPETASDDIKDKFVGSDEAVIIDNQAELNKFIKEYNGDYEIEVVNGNSPVTPYTTKNGREVYFVDGDAPYYNVNDKTFFRSAYTDSGRDLNKNTDIYNFLKVGGDRYNGSIDEDGVDINDYYRRDAKYSEDTLAGRSSKNVRDKVKDKLDKFKTNKQAEKDLQNDINTLQKNNDDFSNDSEIISKSKELKDVKDSIAQDATSDGKFDVRKARDDAKDYYGKTV